MGMQLGPQKRSKKLIAENQGLKEGVKNLKNGTMIIGSVVTETKNKDNQRSLISVLNPKTQKIEVYDFNAANQLGEGAQGIVVMAHNVDTGEMVAVKIQRPQGLNFEEDVNRERQNLLVAKKLIGCAQDNDKNQYTIMEYCKGKNLLEELYEIEPQEDKEAIGRFREKKPLVLIKRFMLMLSAMDEIIHLHENAKLAHRDIKTDNFVSSEHFNHFTLRLIDLGTAIDPNSQDEREQQELGQFVGTFGYIAPEIHRREKYCYKSDLWSLGIVLAEILTDENFQAKLKLLSKENARNNRLEHPSFKDIIIMMSDVLIADLKGQTINYNILETASNIHKLANEGNIDCISELKKLAQYIIMQLTEDNPEKRPTLSQFKKIEFIFREALIKVKMSIFKSYIAEKYQDYLTEPLENNNALPNVGVLMPLPILNAFPPVQPEQPIQPEPPSEELDLIIPPIITRDRSNAF